MMDRRGWLGCATALAVDSQLFYAAIAQESLRKPLPVAAIITEYRTNSHADVIVGKILSGYDQRGGAGPALKLASMYVDQFPSNDLSRGLAEKHGFRLATTIDEALTLGTDQLQVSGVLSIGEHGNYPFTPDTNQHMYPRRRFFEEISASFRRVGKVVPVFNDKHLGYRWSDAKYMVEQAVSQKFPLLAGSSLPVTWRRPSVELPVGCEIEQALAIGYGSLEAYGFHALEMLQCMLERRRGGEQGIAAVRVFLGDEIKRAADRGDWSPELFAAGLQCMPDKPAAELSRLNDRAAFFQLEYRDGLRATIAMANGIAQHFAFAAKLKGEPAPTATWFELEKGAPFSHFGFLVNAIEHMIHTGKTPYAIERTLLTTGALDALMHSLADRGTRRLTPELDVRYQPSQWPFAEMRA